ncbi:hypothetical protein ACFVYJ_04380 [Pontibacter sp. JAM-7]|uniref:hypothetical protein n=1 Tax=Pontibacter sp. JAM-7 TaxID=3366581 RepID=UPI003AF84B70
MNIRVLPSLNTRDQWITFCRREQPYCYVEQPVCLVDFQSSFLQLTLFPEHGDAIKYSLGSRNSMEPAWQLIKACNWQLETLINGLNEMDFSSNVRDNALLQVHTDLTARKVFAREKLLPPQQTGLLKPLTAQPQRWDNLSLCRMISHQQFQDLRSEQVYLQGSQLRPSAPPATPAADELIQLLLEEDQPCSGELREGRLFLLLHGQPIASLIPKLTWPEPRLL